MKYHKRKIVESIQNKDGEYPYTILEFSESLTEDARIKLATKIEFMNELFDHAETMLKDLHIGTVLENYKKLYLIIKNYEDKLFKRTRKHGNISCR